MVGHFFLTVVQLLKSWEYKNLSDYLLRRLAVVQLLKSWEYKNTKKFSVFPEKVVQLLKSWEYKNPFDGALGNAICCTVT